MNLKLHTHRFENLENENIFVFSIIEDNTKDVIFRVYNTRKEKIFNCIKQLEPIKYEVLQLCKDLYTHKYSHTEQRIHWNEQIAPLIKNKEIKQVVL